MTLARLQAYTRPGGPGLFPLTSEDFEGILENSEVGYGSAHEKICKRYAGKMVGALRHGAHTRKRHAIGFACLRQRGVYFSAENLCVANYSTHGMNFVSTLF